MILSVYKLKPLTAFMKTSMTEKITTRLHIAGLFVFTCPI